MAIVVEHDKRKHEILQKSLDVFVDEGYEDATFQKIADRCGITRTTLYIYFKNKHEIFLGSIKELLSDLEQDLISIAENQSLSAKESLNQILEQIINSCNNNKKLFSVLLSYLIQLKKSGENPNDRVRRRVIKLRHLMSTIVIKGIRSGELKRLNVKAMNEMLYGLVEASIFRLAVLNQDNTKDISDSIKLAIDCFCTEK